jgi:Domain of unknown function (DUF5659)
MSAPANKNEFRTPDLYFAAYLQTAGVPLTRHDREGNRVFFIFDTSIANLAELKMGWINRSARIPAQPYADMIKNLKSLCHMG